MENNAVQMPRLGAPLADGRFAGIVFDPTTNEDVALVDLGFSDETMNHKAAKAWAAAKSAHLATREEGRILWATLDSRSAVSLGWFWLDPQFAGGESCAWLQFFDDGTQTSGHKSFDSRARAVRRLPLQPFSNSAIQSAA